MKRYRFVIYALKAVDSLECSTLLETIRKEAEDVIAFFSRENELNLISTLED